MREFIGFIKDHMHKNFMNRTDMAKAMQISVPSMKMYMSGKRIPSMESLKKMRKAFPENCKRANKVFFNLAILRSAKDDLTSDKKSKSLTARNKKNVK